MLLKKKKRFYNFSILLPIDQMVQMLQVNKRKTIYIYIYIYIYICYMYVSYVVVSKLIIRIDDRLSNCFAPVIIDAVNHCFAQWSKA
jgi:hypothetical protein